MAEVKNQGPLMLPGSKPYKPVAKVGGGFPIQVGPALFVVLCVGTLIGGIAGGHMAQAKTEREKPREIAMGNSLADVKAVWGEPQQVGSPIDPRKTIKVVWHPPGLLDSRACTRTAWFTRDDTLVEYVETCGDRTLWEPRPYRSFRDRP